MDRSAIFAADSLKSDRLLVIASEYLHWNQHILDCHKGYGSRRDETAKKGMTPIIGLAIPISLSDTS